MKKFLLSGLSLLMLSSGAFAVDCAKVPHAKIPARNLSLYDKTINNLREYSTVRDIFLKNGWIPVHGPDNTALEFPEENCISDRCIYEYSDKYQNRLYIEKIDDISFVRVDCGKNNVRAK